MSTSETNRPAGEVPEWLELVQRHVASLQYGAVEIIVHDSRVIQIEKIERVRLDKPKADSAPRTKTKL